MTPQEIDERKERARLRSRRWNANNPEKLSAIRERGNIKQREKRAKARQEYYDSIYVEHTPLVGSKHSIKEKRIYALYDEYDNYHGEGNIYEIAEALGISYETVYNKTFDSIRNKSKKHSWTLIRINCFKKKGETND